MHKPRYNILLKENNGYPYFLVTNERKPRLLYTHEYDPKRGKYYGPFANAEMKAYEIYNLLLKLFPLRKCAGPGNRKCFYYDLNMCMGACVGEDTPEKYAAMKAKIDNFFTKGAKEIVAELRAKEAAAAGRTDFEQANRYLELQKAIALLGDGQMVNLKSGRDVDFVGYMTKENYVSIAIFSYVGGRLLSKSSVVSKFVGDISDEVAGYLHRYYDSNVKPSALYLSLDAKRIKLLSNSLGIKIVNPQRGAMQTILETAIKNAGNDLNLRFKTLDLAESRNFAANRELGELLGVNQLSRIEAFDNSNIFNVDRVAAMVVYENGQPNKKEYRKYKIRNDAAKGDYDYMHEVVYRRCLRLLRERRPLPDLIVVDGGKPQVAAAQKALRQLFVDGDVALIGLAKDKKHRTDRIQLPGNRTIALDKKSNLYFYLCNIQEEVHRFAIGYFRRTRRKSAVASALDGVKNLGKVRKAKLLELFGTVSGMRDATLEELCQIVPESVARDLQRKLRNGANQND